MTKDKIVRAKQSPDEVPAAWLKPELDPEIEIAEADIEAAIAENTKNIKLHDQNRPRGPEVLDENLSTRKKRTSPKHRVARAEKIKTVLSAADKRKAKLREAYDKAGGFDGLADRAALIKDTLDEQRRLMDTREYTGGATTYYEAEILHPHKARAPYMAECLDIIEALGMSFAEGEAFKALWRMCAARQGKSKRGYDSAKYDAEKVVFYANRILADVVTPKGKKA